MAASLNPFLSLPHARIQPDVGTVTPPRLYRFHPRLARYWRGRLGCDSGAPPGKLDVAGNARAGPPDGGPGT